MRTILHKIAVLALALAATVTSSSITLADETPQQRDERMAWWREARLGMFVHWGLYSQAAGVWDGKKYYGGVEWIQNSAGVPTAEYEAVLRPLVHPKEG
ncbi:MAG: alpha-L-fucosidase, partial [Verrucomicrobia bacterium]|nr:alpha-L-fucosidase [Verrucomicrobiota bacterium]